MTPILDVSMTRSRSSTYVVGVGAQHGFTAYERRKASPTTASSSQRTKNRKEASQTFCRSRDTRNLVKRWCNYTLIGLIKGPQPPPMRAPLVVQVHRLVHCWGADRILLYQRTNVKIRGYPDLFCTTSFLSSYSYFLVGFGGPVPLSGTRGSTDISAPS